MLIMVFAAVVIAHYVDLARPLTARVTVTSV